MEEHEEKNPAEKTNNCPPDEITRWWGGGIDRQCGIHSLLCSADGSEIDFPMAML